MFKALDLFCGAGGASMGIHRAGFEVIGVDITPQPHYPFIFIQSNALTVELDNYDFIWASPPCQRYSRMSYCRPGLKNTYPDLIEPIRKKLITSKKIYIIENVVNAPLINPVLLCGSMFSKQIYRHRLFESNFSFFTPEHPKHIIPTSRAGHWKPGTFISIAGSFSPIALAKEVMDIDWMNKKELAEAIPPYFSQYLAEQVLEFLNK